MIVYNDTDKNKYLCNMIMYKHCKYRFCSYIHIILMLSIRGVHWHLRDFRPLLWHYTKTNCYNKSCNDGQKKKKEKENLNCLINTSNTQFILLQGLYVYTRINNYNIIMTENVYDYEFMMILLFVSRVHNARVEKSTVLR